MIKRLLARLRPQGTYLNHDQIAALCAAGAIIGHDDACINAASLDLRLGASVLMEFPAPASTTPIDYRARTQMQCVPRLLDEDEGLVLHPGQFVLAHTQEVLSLPDDVAALWRTKSSMGRVALEHMDAGWVDPGFHGALTLEFCNASQYHSIRIRPGDRIGQLVFFKGRAVSERQSYRTKGNYNGNAGVGQIGYNKEKQP